MRRYRQKLFSVLRIVPFLLLLAVLLNYVLRSGAFSVEEIVSYTPENPFLAALVMLALFSVKSLTLFFPLSILYLAAGMIFSVPVALCVCAVGLLLSLTLPYLLGRLLGRRLVDRLFTKYEKTRELERFRSKNACFFACVLRAVKILPVDLVSLLLGAERMPFRDYMLGSLAGLVPTLFSTIALGSSVSDPTSPAFIAAAVITVIFSVLPLAVYPFVMRRERRTEEQAPEDEDE